MARSALTQLQGHIEAIRREAYAAGYAAAMQVIQKAVGGGGAAPATPRRGRPPAAKPAATAPAARAPAARAPAKRAMAKRAMAKRAMDGATKPAKAAKPAAAAKSARAAKAGAGPRRGNNAAMIADILKAIAPRAARPAEIRTALQRDKGASVAFTSIRHALGQLEARQAVEQVGDSKTWRAKA